MVPMWTGIELLHALQDIRLEFPFLEDLFAAMSSRIAYLAVPVALALLFYWCINKKQGEILALSFVPAMVFAVVSKYGFDQPRPWKLDPSIIRIDGVNAHGLSLPSGHTASAVSTYLPAAAFVRNRLFKTVLIVIMVLIIVGRLVLCVHTPLDILSGAVVGIIAITVAWKSIEYAYENDRAYLIVNAAYTVFFTALFIISLVCWDAEADRIALYAGFLYGMLIGRILDRLYLRYEVPQTGIKEHALRFVVGMIIGAAILLVFMVPFPDWGIGLGGALMMVWSFFIYPYIITKKSLFC